MNEEIEQMRGIRELLIKALMVATGASEERIREAPLTEAIKFRKTLANHKGSRKANQMNRSDFHEIEQPLHEEISRLTQALRDIAGSEPIPNPLEAWRFCRDIAACALTPDDGGGK